MLSMLLVLLYHSSFNTFGFPSDVASCRLGIVVLSAFTVIGVNVFVLLTGYFSVIPKKRSVANLIFICFFYMLVKVVFEWISSHSIVLVNLFFISSSSWYIVVYLGLLLFSPMLNDFVDKCGKRQLGVFIIMLFLYETWFGFFPGISHGYGFSNGYSVVSFILLYLIGRFIRLYDIPQKVEYSLKIAYPLLSCLFVVIFYFAIASGYKSEKMAGYICGYNNPLIIFSALGFLMLFRNIKVGEKIGGVINYLAQSNLAVLFIHSSIDFFPMYSRLFRHIDAMYGGVGKVAMWGTSVFCIYFMCVLIDQIRLLLWKNISVSVF